MNDWHGPLCVTAGTSEIPCHEWLCGDCADSTSWPKHICPGVMAWSVRHFIEQRAGGDWQAAFDGFWPLPAGAHAIQEWPAHAEEAATNWAVLHSMHENPDIGAFRVRDVPPVDLPRWYFPIVTNNADALVGLAAQRHIDGVGSVGLLGLVEHGTDDPSWWRWADPIILTEAGALLAADLNALNNSAKSLMKWYKKELLGKPAPGRPKGSKEYWRDKEDFVSAVETAIKALVEARKNVTQQSVAEYLANDDLRVPRSNPTGKSGGYSFDQFKRDRKDYGFKKWEDLKNFCAS